jgi:hypothetical protein
VHNSEPPKVGRVAASDLTANRQFGAIGGEAGEQRGGDRAGKIAPEVGRAEQQDFRLVRFDQVGERLRIGLVAVFGEDRVFDEVGEVGAVDEAFGRRLAGSPPRRADDDCGKRDAALVGELAALAHQLPRDGLNLARARTRPCPRRSCRP